MKYLKKFSNHNGYDGFINTDKFIRPNVSICKEELDVHFNQLILPHDYSKDYLIIESLEDDNTISWKASNSGLTKTISISTDNGTTWIDQTSTTSGVILATLNTGNKLIIKGINTSYGNSSNYNYFISTKEFNVEGNIMSLVYGDDFIGQTILDSVGYNFKYLFYNCTKLKNSENLMLPATTLTNQCYSKMFQGCTALTVAPELPTTTLAQGCYNGMFKGCTALTVAPELPATTLTHGCYSSMFNGCTSLTTAPELPAKTLARNCYDGMFQGCISLSTAPELPATTLVNNYYCYTDMFNGCTSLTTAPDLPAKTLANDCYNSMFEGCTSLVTAPELPATTLATECYYGMFRGCTSLVTAPELPATTLASDCYLGMFMDCTSLTTAPELPATTLIRECYYHMFRGCTSLVTAPELPATTLTSSCYLGMFRGCKSLNYIKCLATNISATDCTTNWVENVASTGTFIKAESMTSWTTGTNGIPSRWTVQDYVAS